MAKNYTEEDINNISYICFDEKGDWKPKQDFSNEWGIISYYEIFFIYTLEKKNRKTDKPRIKPMKPNRSTNSEQSDPIKHPGESLNMDNASEQNSDNHHEEVIIMTDSLNPNPDRSINNFSSNSNRLYAEEITVEHCVMIHRDLMKSTSKVEMTSNEIVDKITTKLKEFNVFKNFSDRKFYEFLMQAEINLYITSFFEEGKNLLENKEFEDICEEVSKSASAEIVKYALAWANTKENCVEITYLISTRNENQGFDIKFALELLMIFAFLIFKRRISININRKHLLLAFGELLNCLSQRLLFNFMIKSIKKNSLGDLKLCISKRS